MERKKWKLNAEAHSKLLPNIYDGAFCGNSYRHFLKNVIELSVVSKLLKLLGGNLKILVLMKIGYNKKLSILNLSERFS